MTNWENDPTVKIIRRLEEIGKENGIKNTVWSLLKSMKPWNKVAYHGTFKLYDPCADENGFVTVTDPTWMDIWKACDQLVLLNKDLHHIFVESVKKSGNTIKVIFGS